MTNLGLVVLFQKGVSQCMFGEPERGFGFAFENCRISILGASE